jgi:hypothetical protein
MDLLRHWEVDHDRGEYVVVADPKGDRDVIARCNSLPDAKMVARALNNSREARAALRALLDASRPAPDGGIAARLDRARREAARIVAGGQ